MDKERIVGYFTPEQAEQVRNAWARIKAKERIVGYRLSDFIVEAVMEKANQVLQDRTGAAS